MAYLNRLVAKQIRANDNDETEEPEEGECGDDETDALIGQLLASKNDEWTPHTITGYGPETRSVLIAGEINPALATAICSQLEALDIEDPLLPIKVIINSPGGDVIQALAIYDVMRAIRAPIITIVQGMAFSGGFLLLQGGDLRLAFPNSKLFYHEPLSEAQVSSRAEQEEHTKSYAWSLDTMNDIIQKRAKIPTKQWNKIFTGKTAIFFTAKEAIELNLIDEAIEFPEKPAIVLEDDLDTEEVEEVEVAE